MAMLLAVFLIGLVGSAHCAGMCGGFVVALAQMGGGRRFHLNQALYYAGKTSAYALLGALAGGLGSALGGAFASAQHALGLALGLVLVVIGLGLAGALRRLEGTRLWTRVPGLGRALGGLIARGGPLAVAGLGALNGLLPCGLVYGVLALAATAGGAGQGALVMATFGLATVPALYLTGLAGSLARPAWRARLGRLSGVLMIALGLLTMARGTSALDDLLHHGHDGPRHGPHATHQTTAEPADHLHRH